MMTSPLRRFPTGLLGLALVAAAVGCADEVPAGSAGVKLTIRYPAALEPDELVVTLVVDRATAQKGTLPEQGRTLGETESTAELLLAAELDGVAVGVRVDGLTDGVVVASEQDSVTPRVGEWTPLVVTLGAPAVVGDGVVHATAEECDDRNATAGDGCDAAGFVEDGFTCVGEPSACTTDRVDAGPADGGVGDAGPADGGLADAGPADGGVADAGVPAGDAGVQPDAGVTLDAGPDADAGTFVDAGLPDAGGAPDAGFDAGYDAGMLQDAGFDAGYDAGPPDIVINEVSASDDDPLELFNRSAFAANLGGWIVSDEQFPGDIGNRAILPANTMIPANGYLVLRKGVDFAFGFGGQDEARLFLPDQTLVDATGWPDSQAEISWCRSPNGTGPFGECNTATFGSANP